MFSVSFILAALTIASAVGVPPSHFSGVILAQYDDLTTSKLVPLEGATLRITNCTDCQIVNGDKKRGRVCPADLNPGCDSPKTSCTHGSKTGKQITGKDGSYFWYCPANWGMPAFEISHSGCKTQHVKTNEGASVQTLNVTLVCSKKKENNLLSPYPNNMVTAAGIAKSYYKAHTPLPPFGTPGHGCPAVPCKGYCDHYVAKFFGLSSSGFVDAAQHWAEMPAIKKLPGWQPGALAFFAGGEHGHIAIGDVSAGMVYSTDVTSPSGGYVGHKSTEWVAAWMKGSFLGWTKPWFK